MGENRCISCGDIIPEGIMTCKQCESNKRIRAIFVEPNTRFENVEVWGFKQATKNIRDVAYKYKLNNANSDTKILLCKNHPMIDVKKGELNECFRIGDNIIYVEMGQEDISLSQKLIDKYIESKDYANCGDFLTMIHVAVDVNVYEGRELKETNILEMSYAQLRFFYSLYTSPICDSDIAWCKWIESLPYARELICYRQ